MTNAELHYLDIGGEIGPMWFPKVMAAMRRAFMKHPMAEWSGKGIEWALSRLSAEVGEVAQAVVKEEGEDRITSELIDVIVVALRVMAHHYDGKLQIDPGSWFYKPRKPRHKKFGRPRVHHHKIKDPDWRKRKRWSKSRLARMEKERIEREMRANGIV